MSRLTRGGTAETVSQDQILRHERGQGSIHFPCSTDHEQDWQPYPVDPTLAYSSRTKVPAFCSTGIVVVVVVFTLKAVPVSTQYFLTSVLVQLTRTPSVVTG